MEQETLKGKKQITAAERTRGRGSDGKRNRKLSSEMKGRLEEDMEREGKLKRYRIGSNKQKDSNHVRR